MKKMEEMKEMKKLGGARLLTGAELQAFCDRYTVHYRTLARDTKRRAVQERRAKYPRLQAHSWRVLQARRVRVRPRAAELRHWRQLLRCEAQKSTAAHVPLRQKDSDTEGQLHAPAAQQLQEAALEVGVATIDIAGPPCAEQSGHIYIGINGENRPLRMVLPAATADTLAEELAAALELPPGRSSLQYGGTVLKPGNTLGSYGVRFDTAWELIRATCYLRGGGGSCSKPGGGGGSGGGGSGDGGDGSGSGGSGDGGAGATVFYDRDHMGGEAAEPVEDNAAYMHGHDGAKVEPARFDSVRGAPLPTRHQREVDAGFPEAETPRLAPRRAPTLVLADHCEEVDVDSIGTRALTARASSSSGEATQARVLRGSRALSRVVDQIGQLLGPEFASDAASTGRELTSRGLGACTPMSLFASIAQVFQTTRTHHPHPHMHRSYLHHCLQHRSRHRQGTAGCAPPRGARARALFRQCWLVLALQLNRLAQAHSAGRHRGRTESHQEVESRSPQPS